MNNLKKSFKTAVEAGLGLLRKAQDKDYMRAFNSMVTPRQSVMQLLAAASPASPHHKGFGGPR